MNRVEIGSSPCNEACAQIGITENAQDLNRLECRAYIFALRRKYGPEPENAKLIVRGNPHDMGTYYEVVCTYVDNDYAAFDYALKLENGLETWAEVGMQPPVTYHDNGQPYRILHTEDGWLMPVREPATT